MIVVHLGSPKTGTSVIQFSLVRLEGQTKAFSYPVAFRGDRTAHHDLPQRLRTPDHFEGLIDEVSGMLAPADHQDMVISSEQFFNLLSQERLPRLMRFLEISSARSETVAVLYLRRWDDFVNSMFLQSARVGSISLDAPAYAAKQLRLVSNFFAIIRKLSDMTIADFRVFAYNPKVDIRQHFESLMPSLGGLSKVGSLPRTEKLTLKQQVALSFSSDLLGLPVDDKFRKRLAARIKRLGELRFPDDVTDYCVLPAELDTKLRMAALSAARMHGIESYVEAFADAAPVKNYKAYDPSVLTPDDIKLFRDYATRLLRHLRRRQEDPIGRH